ncbi:hypothetical protein M8494_01335 [Serratia ureilytica]
MLEAKGIMPQIKQNLSGASAGAIAALLVGGLQLGGRHQNSVGDGF